MKIKARENDYSTIDVFKTDVLNRKMYSDKIAEIFASAEESLVLAINGKWGSGKTFFSHMLKKSIEEKGFQVVYFNAWENDFYKDPLPAIISELSTVLSASSIAIEQLKTVGMSLLKVGIPQVIKLLSLGVLDLKDITSEMLAAVASEYISSTFSEYGKTKDDVRKFKEKLRDALKDSTGNAKKTVFIIDELDRCRPIFSIEVLEIAKHLFQVENLHFIFSVDYQQLGASIKKCYGNDIDVEGYLRRFIDLTFVLPQPSTHDFIEYLFREHEFSDFYEARKKIGIDDEKHLQNIICDLSEFYHLSLRDIEKMIIRLSIIIKTTEDKYYLFPDVLAFLLVLKIADNDMYERVSQKRITAEEIILYLEKTTAMKNYIYHINQENYNGLYFISSVLLLLHDSTKEPNAYMYLDKLIEGKGEKATWAGEIKRISQGERNGRNWNGSMKYLKEKVDMVAPFVR